MSAALKKCMQGWSIDWKPVLFYAQMANGREELMVGTLKHFIAPLAHGDTNGWEKKLSRAVYGYLRHTIASGISPYSLIYVIMPQLVSSDGFRVKSKYG